MTREDFGARQHVEPLPIIEAGTAALIRLLAVSKNRSHQSKICGRFLLGLYSSFWLLDLTSLRGLDMSLHSDVQAVLALDRLHLKEVQAWLQDGEAIWRDLKVRWSTKDEAQRLGESLLSDWRSYHPFKEGE